MQERKLGNSIRWLLARESVRRAAQMLDWMWSRTTG